MLLLASTQTVFAQVVIRIGTLAPVGSPWEANLKESFREVEKASNGAVKFVLYAGGVLGDEGDMVRKIRLGGLQGGAFASMGASVIAPETSVLKLPYLFDDLDEVDHIRSRGRARFSALLERNGFKMLTWTDVGGLAQIFSKVPIRTVDDLKKTRVWVWQGDPISHASFKLMGVEPVPLDITQVFGALKTGMVETVGGTGLSVLALQWFSDLPYVMRANARYEPGFLLIEMKTWKRIPPDVQRMIEERLLEREPGILAQTRRDERTAFDALVRKGMKVIEFTPEERAKYRTEQRAVWEEFADKLYPRDLLNFIEDELLAFRSALASTD